jgi:hypothetical protein
MKIAATNGTRVHTPECTRAAYLSAYTSGADLLHLPLRLSGDGHAVVTDDAVTDTLAVLREVDRGEGFKTGTGTPFRYPARLESFEALLHHLPEGPELLCDLLDDDPVLMEQVLAAARVRRRDSTLIFVVHDAAMLAHARAARVRVAWAGNGLLPAGSFTAAVVSIERMIGPDADPQSVIAEYAARHASGALELGVILRAEGLVEPAELEAARALPFVYAVCVDSVPEAAAVLRPGRLWLRGSFAGTAAEHADVDRDLWHLGYAKHGPYCHVYVDDGVVVDIEPFDRPVAFEPTGDPVRDRLNRLQERSWQALKDWPWYAGGGVGCALGISGDFSAEIDMESAVACQATTVELAAVNVDPPSHRTPWRADGSPNLTRSRRDQRSFFDPHGLPPYVGVEHDEDDGWRINWNLGTSYDANHYGKAFGDGNLLRGRVRLQRRGSYWSAWVRLPHERGHRAWVCVGAVRNDSMNDTVFLRCAGKRWRQESSSDPEVWRPVVGNRFVFRDFTITRYP